MRKQIYIAVGDGANRDRTAFLTLEEAVVFKESNTTCGIWYEIRIVDDRRIIYPEDKRKYNRRK